MSVLSAYLAFTNYRDIIVYFIEHFNFAKIQGIFNINLMLRRQFKKVYLNAIVIRQIF